TIPPTSPYLCHFFLLILRPPPRPTLFPYTTLFRSLAALLGRIRSYQDKDFWGTADNSRHGKTPKCDFDHYLRRNLVFDTAEVLRSEEHTSELQSRFDLVCRLLLEKKKKKIKELIII